MPDHGVAETTGSIGQTAALRKRLAAGGRNLEGTLHQESERSRSRLPLRAALRATGQRTQAVAVLEQATIHNPKNTLLLGAYGRALADIGAYNQALEVLGRAHTPDQPDWRILSAQGAVLDQMGRHEDARRYYSSALKIMPDEPSVLSNLGLSYALSKNLPKAEEVLRQASEQKGAEQRVRQNLALVIGLQGRYPGSRSDRARRPAARGSVDQCRLSAPDDRAGSAAARTARIAPSALKRSGAAR